MAVTPLDEEVLVALLEPPWTAAEIRRIRREVIRGMYLRGPAGVGIGERGRRVVAIVGQRWRSGKPYSGSGPEELKCHRLVVDGHVGAVRGGVRTVTVQYWPVGATETLMSGLLDVAVKVWLASCVPLPSRLS